MKRIATGALAALLVVLPVGLSVTAVPASAQDVAATAVDAKAAGVFVDQLSDEAFAVLRDKSVSRTAARTKFRAMLKANFTIDAIGAKLIRRQRATLTPAQLSAYSELFPDWVVGTYANSLYDFSNSDLKIIRALPRGARGDIDVHSRIALPGGGSPIDAVWSVRKQPSGKFVIQNLTVAGVNLALTQEADFTAYIQKNGFDGLLKFMRDAAKAS